MLKPYFSPVTWTHIYEAHVSIKPIPETKTFAYRTVLHIYTLECYTLEARIRDYNKFLAPASLSEYQYSIDTDLALILELGMKVQYKNYLEYLLTTRFWSPAELRQFFIIHKCLSEFHSPDYKKITKNVIAEAMSYHLLITKKVTHKREVWRTFQTQNLETRNSDRILTNLGLFLLLLQIRNHQVFVQQQNTLKHFLFGVSGKIT